MNIGSAPRSSASRVDFYIWIYRIKVGVLVLVPLLAGVGGTILALSAKTGSFWQSIGVELSSATVFFILAMMLLPLARWRRKTFVFTCLLASAVCAFYASRQTGLAASWLIEASVGILMIVVLDLWISGVIQALRKDKEEYEKWDERSKNMMNMFIAMPIVFLVLAWKALKGEIKAPAEWIEEYEKEKAQSRISSKHLEAIALASAISIAASILISHASLHLEAAVVVLIVWTVVAGIILSQQKIAPARLCIKLALLPSALLCLTPIVMALFRSLLAYVNPGRWLMTPGKIAAVFGVAFVITTILLTLTTLAGSRMLKRVSNPYSTKPETFERVEKIVKYVIAILSVVSAWFLLR